MFDSIISDTPKPNNHWDQNNPLAPDLFLPPRWDVPGQKKKSEPTPKTDQSTGPGMPTFPELFSPLRWDGTNGPAPRPDASATPGPAVLPEVNLVQPSLPEIKRDSEGRITETSNHNNQNRIVYGRDENNVLNSFTRTLQGGREPVHIYQGGGHR